MVVVTHQAEKFGLMTIRAPVQGATFNMRGQLCRGHANATALSSSPVVSALGSESDAGARRCALETCGKKKKKLRF